MTEAVRTIENTGTGHRVVDDVLEMYLRPEDNVMRKVRESHRQNNIPEIEVSALQARQLELMVRSSRAQTVLEIGTLAGYSTMAMERGLPREAGWIDTIEFEPRHADVARHNFLINGIPEDRIQVHVGAALDVLPTLDTVSYDFVFIDADKENNLAYLQWAVELTHGGSTIVVDNVIRDGRFISRPEKLDFIRAVGMDFGDTLEATVIQTVGSKGWDGYVMAVRK